MISASISLTTFRCKGGWDCGCLDRCVAVHSSEGSVKCYRAWKGWFPGNQLGLLLKNLYFSLVVFITHCSMHLLQIQ